MDHHTTRYHEVITMMMIDNSNNVKNNSDAYRWSELKREGEREGKKGEGEREGK